MRESQCARLARAGQSRATSPSKSDANCCSPETSSCRRLLFLQSRIGKINPFLDTRLFKISVASGVRKHTGYVFGRDAPSPALLNIRFRSRSIGEARSRRVDASQAVGVYIFAAETFVRCHTVFPVFTAGALLRQSETIQYLCLKMAAPSPTIASKPLILYVEDNDI